MKKNTPKKFLFLVAGVGIGLAFTAAALAHPGGGRSFANLDTTGDGVVDRTEFEAAHAQRVAKWFSKVDVDGDGTLSLSEIQAHKQEKMGKRFARMDRDGDGVLSQDELKEARQRRRAHRGGGRN